MPDSHPPPVVDYRPHAADRANSAESHPRQRAALGFGLATVMAAGGFGAATLTGDLGTALVVLLVTAAAILLTAVWLVAGRQTRMIGAGMFMAIGVGGLFVLPLCGR